MQKLTTMTSVITLSLVLAGCFGSDSEQAVTPAVNSPTALVGVAENGAIYYQTNCGICHQVGPNDPTSAFGASDLAQKHNMITTDMSNFDTTSTFNLMASYNNVPEQRVADLKAYLETVPKL
jgi:mono/diheme cytochrome c family protein